jgi:hypothetical protein
MPRRHAVGARAWVLNTQLHRSGNIAVGLGIKTPSGNSGYKDMYPDSAGRTTHCAYVDQSVQPGDGGWGLLVDISGFRRIPARPAVRIAELSREPRDAMTRRRARSTARRPESVDGGGYAFNSVPDQFLARFGARCRSAGPDSPARWPGAPKACRATLIGAATASAVRHRAVHRAGVSFAKGRQFYSTAGADRLLPQPVPEPAIRATRAMPTFRVTFVWRRTGIDCKKSWRYPPADLSQ